MAAATACASTALAGQSLLKPVNELSRKVGTSEARITMRKSKSSSSDSIWYVPFHWHGHFSGFAHWLSIVLAWSLFRVCTLVVIVLAWSLLRVCTLVVNCVGMVTFPGLHIGCHCVGIIASPGLDIGCHCVGMVASPGFHIGI
jgi:hypothetical protein